MTSAPLKTEREIREAVKKRFKILKTKNPNTKLSRVYDIIAAEHGFRTWQAMKAALSVLPSGTNTKNQIPDVFAHTNQSIKKALHNLIKNARRIIPANIVLNGPDHDLALYLFRNVLLLGGNIMISGPTGIGKTTLQNTILDTIPKNKTIGIIDNSEEISTKQKNNPNATIATTKTSIKPEKPDCDEIVRLMLQAETDIIAIQEGNPDNPKYLTALLLVAASGTGLISTKHTNSLNKENLSDFIIVHIDRQDPTLKTTLQISFPTDSSP